MNRSTPSKISDVPSSSVMVPAESSDNSMKPSPWDSSEPVVSSNVQPSVGRRQCRRLRSIAFEDATFGWRSMKRKFAIFSNHRISLKFKCFLYQLLIVII